MLFLLEIILIVQLQLCTQLNVITNTILMLQPPCALLLYITLMHQSDGIITQSKQLFCISVLLATILSIHQASWLMIRCVTTIWCSCRCNLCLLQNRFILLISLYSIFMKVLVQYYGYQFNLRHFELLPTSESLFGPAGRQFLHLSTQVNALDLASSTITTDDILLKENLADSSIPWTGEPLPVLLLL